MRRRVAINGFDTGLIDEQYEDRLDIEGMNRSLRECTNFDIMGSGAAKLRPEFDNVSGTKDWNSVSGLTVANLKTYPISDSKICVVASSTSASKIYTWSTANATASVGTFGLQKPTGFLRVGKAAYFLKNDNTPKYSTDIENASALANVEFYEEMSGTVQAATRITIKITAPLDPLASIPLAIPVVGEAIKGVNGTTDATGIVLRVRLLSDSSVNRDPTVAGWQYEIILGQCNGTITVGDEIGFGTSDCTGEVLVDDGPYFLFGTGTTFTYYGTSDVRINGESRGVDAVEDDELLNMTLIVSGSILDARAFRPITSPQFTCAALYGGRIVWCGNGRSGSEGAVGGLNTVVFSDAEEPHCVVAAPNAVPNPASAIKVQLLSTGRSIKWAAAGDALIVGTDTGEYVMDQKRVGNSPDLFPVFRLTSQYGSDDYTKVTDSDGRIIFSPRSGGDLIALQYNQDSDRYNAIPLNQYTPSIISNGVTAIGVRPRREEDDATRIYVIDATGDDTLRMGTMQQDRIAWTNYKIDSRGTAPASFYDLVQMGKDMYVIMQGLTYNSFFMAKLDHTQTDGYALDFRDSCTNVGTTWTTDEPLLYSRDVAVIGYRGSQWVPFGMIATNGSGQFTISSDEGFTAVKVGIPVEGTMTLARIVSEDQQGSTLGRNFRLISATINVQDTVQFSLNNKTMLPQRMDGTQYQPFTRGVKRGFMGWKQDHKIRVESVAPHQCTIKSVLCEIGL